MAVEHRMIEPFAPELVRESVVSYGVSSFGYDFRLAGDFKVLRPEFSGTLDPKAQGADVFEETTCDACIVPPRSFVLARSLEYFRIPRSVLTLCTGKSTYARCGVVVNVTPFEPEWEGYATLCIVNAAPVPVCLYAGEGIGQVIFFESDTPCDTSYADRKGKYQTQQAITVSRL
jgi:dCTP deaminase